MDEALEAARRRLTVEHDDVALSVPGPGRRGRAPQLTVGGRIFAMVHGGRLVLKLPAVTVTGLVAAGEGVPYTLGSRTMREWVVLTDLAEERRDGLVDAACAFVAGLPR